MESDEGKFGLIDPTATFWDCISGKFFENVGNTGNEAIKKTLAESKLKEMLNREREIHNKSSDVENEFDFKRLEEYVLHAFWTDFPKVFLGSSVEIRQGSYEMVLKLGAANANIGYGADKSMAKTKTDRIVIEALAILAAYYEKGISYTDQYRGNRIIDQVVENGNNNTKEIIQIIEKYAKEMREEFQIAMRDISEEKKEISLTRLGLRYQENSLNKTVDFVEGWNKTLFLDDTLSLDCLYDGVDGFYMPDYEENGKEQKDLADRIMQAIESQEGLIIFGPPGIGKSTIMTWVCNRVKQKEIVAYSFADIFSERLGVSVKCVKEDPAYILERTELKTDTQNVDLSGKILLLDGLDEVVREISDMKQYVMDLMSRYKRYGMIPIITCRTNYVTDTEYLKRQKIAYVTLKPWKEEKITIFVRKYAEKTGKEIQDSLLESLYKNESLYGIPLILYMVLALNIEIGDKDDETSVYDRIFDEKGKGIFGRVIKGRKGKDSSYEKTGVIPQITEKEKTLIQKAMCTSREIAFDMFESGTENVYRPFEYMPKDYKAFFIDTKMTEGEVNVQFIHRSMYEYFAVEYLLEKLKTKCFEDKNSRTELAPAEELAKVLAHFCKRGQITDTENWNSLLFQFVNTKLRKLFLNCGFLDTAGQLRADIYLWWENAATILFEKGMLTFAYCEDNSMRKCTNSLGEEMQCAKNVLDLLGIVYETYNPEKNFKAKKRMLFHYMSVSEENRQYMSRYVRTIMAYRKSLCLNSAYLRSADLSSADLRFVDLRFADLRSADLRFADLYSAYLSSADLISANLYSAYLSSADLRFANLYSADLSSADLSSADLRSADLRSADLSSSDLRSANLSSADLRSADLRFADLDKARITTKGISKLTGKEVNNFPLKNIGSAKFDIIYVDNIDYPPEKFFAHLDEDGMFQHDI